MTDEQREQAQAQKEAYERSKVGEWNPKNGTLLLDVDPALIDVHRIEDRAKKEHVDRKQEFHITLIGFKAGKEMIKALRKNTPEQQALMQQEIVALVADLNQGWKLGKEVMRITKEYPPDPSRPEELPERRTSYIQIADVPKISEFYVQVNAMLGLHLAAPPTHITLMTGSTNPSHQLEGIGIPDRETLEGMHPEIIQQAEGENNK